MTGRRLSSMLMALTAEALLAQERGAAVTLAGVNVIPHIQSNQLRYRREPDRSLGARVQLFLRNDGTRPVRFGPQSGIVVRGKSPEQLLEADEWAWHDFPSAWPDQPLELPPGALTAWSFNGKRAAWGPGTQAVLTCPAGQDGEPDMINVTMGIERPHVCLSTVAFMGAGAEPFPNRMVLHVENRSPSPLRLDAVRLWLPKSNATWRALRPQPWITRLDLFPNDGIIPVNDRGGARIDLAPLPLTYAAVEIRLADENAKTRPIWAHVRIRRDQFDIGGGWVAGEVNGRSALTLGPYLKTLKRLHINTGNIADVPGYTDNAGLYEQYPLKLFNRLTPLDRFDRDDVLPRIHAVEFLGEPQYGGGHPVAPMTVWKELTPFQTTRLATSVTLSEERTWRFYAGLSDYAHFDAYRVVAPAADSFRMYERWGRVRLRWGAPLETIGDLTRSLRDLNRPAPIAAWAQGAHAGWDGWDGRKRRSPTPDELRVQAYHALANRVTSLYWFNLSLESLLAFPDLIEPIAQIGREIRLLEEFYLEGDATHYERLLHEGELDWDTSVIASPRGVACFAIDLAYGPDPDARVFRFGPPRDATLSFPLPAYARDIRAAWSVSAGAVTPVAFEIAAGRLVVTGRHPAVAVIVASADAHLGTDLEARRQALMAAEDATGFDPGGDASDLRVLRSLLQP